MLERGLKFPYRKRQWYQLQQAGQAGKCVFSSGWTDVMCASMQRSTGGGGWREAARTSTREAFTQKHKQEKTLKQTNQKTQSPHSWRQNQHEGEKPTKALAELFRRWHMRSPQGRNKGNYQCMRFIFLFISHELWGNVMDRSWVYALRSRKRCIHWEDVEMVWSVRLISYEVCHRLPGMFTMQGMGQSRKNTHPA